jgi:cytidylate kinase
VPAAAERPRPLVVAIDGPSGSGKSSVSRAVARKLGLGYLDTGAMYRAATWACVDAGIILNDEAAVAAHVTAMDLRMGTDPENPTVQVGDVDVAKEIRSTRISASVSNVATNQAVRDELRRRQRDLIAAESSGKREGCVAEGRDITTVVAPDADVRILLTASEEARLARRALEVHGSADAKAVAATRDQVVRRDRDDSTVATFHVAADGVVELDSSSLDFEQTVKAVLQVIVTTLAESGELGAVVLGDLNDRAGAGVRA